MITPTSDQNFNGGTTKNVVKGFQMNVIAVPSQDINLLPDRSFHLKCVSWHRLDFVGQEGRKGFFCWPKGKVVNSAESLAHLALAPTSHIYQKAASAALYPHAMSSSSSATVQCSNKSPAQCNLVDKNCRCRSLSLSLSHIWIILSRSRDQEKDKHTDHAELADRAAATKQYINAAQALYSQERDDNVINSREQFASIVVNFHRLFTNNTYS